MTSPRMGYEAQGSSDLVQLVGRRRGRGETGKRGGLKTRVWTYGVDP